VSTKVLVLAAHPDDAELSCGGTIKQLTNEGRTVVIVDCTRGELGTRGTPERRRDEAIAAAAILGVDTRLCLNMPDGGIVQSEENVHAVVSVIRRVRPYLLLIPPPIDRHPDHEAVHALGRSAAFLAGLKNVTTIDGGIAQESHRPHRILCYQQHYELPTGHVIYSDVSNTFHAKMDAIRAFASQFHVPEAYISDEPQTHLTREGFLVEVEARSRYFGSLIGVTHAEAFVSTEPLGVPSLSMLL